MTTGTLEDLGAFRPGSSIDLVVDNGFGGEASDGQLGSTWFNTYRLQILQSQVAVPTNGQAEVMPIRDGLGQWSPVAFRIFRG